MFGETFRKRREEAGLDLRGVAHTLRIQYEYLKALENGSLEKLPPDVYVKAYIREYAKFLNIDAGPIIDEYAALTKKDEEVVRPAPPPRKGPSLFLISSSVALVVAFIAGFIVFMHTRGRSPDTFTYESNPVAPASPVPQTASGKTEPEQRISKPVPPAREPSQHMLDVTAIEKTWLRVETGEGRSEEVLMNPGETRKWASQNGFSLRVGNAGGVRLLLDSRDIGVLGEKGQVVNLRLPEESGR